MDPSGPLLEDICLVLGGVKGRKAKKVRHTGIIQSGKINMKSQEPKFSETETCSSPDGKTKMIFCQELPKNGHCFQ